jgi:hypothetical protein
MKNFENFSLLHIKNFEQTGREIKMAMLL